MIERRPTISDVAREAGVSIATVSRVMRQKESVTPALADRVREAAERLGYRPSPVARGLALGESRMVGVFVPQLSNPYFHLTLKAIGAGTTGDGYRLLVQESNDVIEDEVEVIDTLYRHADGVIVLSPRMPDERLRALAADRPRLVCVGRIPVGIGIPSIAVDSYSAMLEMAGLLARLGHRKVAFIAGPHESWYNIERWRAVQQAAAFGLESVRVPGGYTVEQGYASTDEALEHEPTAIMASNDLSAVGVLSRLRELGIAVPGEISVTGFDDIPFAGHLDPTLTTARSPQDRLGALAWDLLRSLIDGEPPALDQPLLEAEVVVRNSTGPAREEART
jgi:LacI family repressor for deo operon, udp, cdd, tsx, nupC, and nupG